MSVSGWEARRADEITEALRSYAASFPRIEFSDAKGDEWRLSTYRGTKALREACSDYLKATDPLMSELVQIGLRAMPQHKQDAAYRNGRLGI